jgi:hypothetical protein
MRSVKLILDLILVTNEGLDGFAYARGRSENLSHVKHRAYRARYPQESKALRRTAAESHLKDETLMRSKVRVFANAQGSQPWELDPLILFALLTGVLCRLHP